MTDEQKKQFMQLYGITEEQLDDIIDKLAAVISQIWEAVKEVLERAAAIYAELAENLLAVDWQELIEQIRGALEKKQPPTYNRADTRNAQYNAKLKGYKNKYMRSAAIRVPKRSARSCC